MKKTSVLLVLAFCLCSPALVERATAQNPQAGAAAPGEQKVSGWEAEKQFLKAHELMIKQEYAQSAIEVRKASAFVKGKAERAAQETKTELKKSAQELDGLADRLEKGTETSVKNMENIFARAHHALAQYFREEAVKSYAAKEYGKAGNEITSSAESLRNGFTWMKTKIDKGTNAAISESRRLGDKMVKGADWTADEAHRGLAYLDDEIKKFGNKLK
jgi:hypothetical protein